jgi:hypothetical protein
LLRLVADGRQRLERGADQMSTLNELNFRKAP